ncbi:MAG: AbrB/MazE/SpoVT family DNA-binding domain-containing protein [Saprospiraceae bacterium]|nr:AbrB/MazE/SpoVT family DNA-binding domain-containing protein [Saprospiraceae bacterium]
MTVTINKWGHSLGLRLPKDLAAKNDLEIGSVVEFLESPMVY